jgi:acetyl-CoA synthetase
MFLGVWNDARGAETYWNRVPGAYATGDWARREKDGGLSLLGRIDPVVSISAQLVSLAEVRDALLEHPYVADAEIVERIDRQAGPSVAACVVLADSLRAGDGLARVLREHVRERVGGLAQPRLVAFVDAFPADVDEETRRLALRMLCAAASGDEAHFSVTELRAAASSVPSA